MTPMNGVNYLVGSEHTLTSPMRVFDEEVCTFIAELSSTLLRSPVIRTFPDLAALAFWGRRANIQKIKEEAGDVSDRLGRGLCFHITPSNIPINFAFSWLFSLLAGNANIVRLPSKSFLQVEELCAMIARVLKNFPRLQKRNALIRYPRSNDITAAFCAQADARMIWGGDATIALVKTMPALPRCVDIAFADRYSLALLDAAAIRAVDGPQLQRLADDFYNDTFLMDQNACSSPQVILWQNDDEVAREKFWSAVVACATHRYQLQDAVAVDKYTALCEESIDGGIVRSFKHAHNLVYRVELQGLTPAVIECRGKGGFFHEYAIKNWNELFSIITEKFQTITCFGIDRQALQQAIIGAGLRGIDRIVPVGKAMDINTIWDGHDLIKELSKKIALV